MTEILTSPENTPPAQGRPSRFNETLEAAICHDIAEGVPVSKAFPCNGISARTGFNWLRSRPGFAREVQRALDHYRRSHCLPYEPPKRGRRRVPTRRLPIPHQG